MSQSGSEGLFLTEAHKEVDLHRLMHSEALQGGDLRISEAFILEHQGYVESIARTLISSTKLPPGVGVEDLDSWGIEGLIKAKRGYNPNKGTAFKTYAYYRIRGEILDRLRKEWTYRAPSDYQSYRSKMEDRIADYIVEGVNAIGATENAETRVNEVVSSTSMAYLLSIDTFDVASQSEGTLDPAVEYELKYGPTPERMVLEHLDSLEVDERNIIQLFYFEGIKQKDIAEQMKISKSKVCRIHTKALEKLRKKIVRSMRIGDTM